MTTSPDLVAGEPETARLVAAAGHWRTVAAATGPAARRAAEDGVRLAYRAAGLAAPEHIVWAGSPLEATAMALLLTGRHDLTTAAADAATSASAASSAAADAAADRAGTVVARARHALEAAGVVPGPQAAGPCVREAVRTRPWEEERQRLLAFLGPGGWAERWALTGAGLWQSTAALTLRIRDGITDVLAPGTGTGTDPVSGAARGLRSAVRQALLDSVAGQHDAPWLAAFDGAGHRLDGLAAVARAAGWWWPYERVAVLAERPVELHRDEAGRLDRADGPALAFPDGFALHAWRGMPVPAGFLDDLAGITPERIRTEDNAELRRVMLEHYGYDRYLADSGARPLHRDETGVLWRIDLGDDEPVVMVEVVNSTPEPDGTSRVYWLRVPPATRTAREGVAWTFGVDPDSYRPERET
ncbi:DUF6745 domain-containing protein [Streptomyces sp. SCUT-3]|uniref:DUF6745 domain-containing protein n=1 Tax=Streptomyces sp. SCUT-3 TaxID=2684469 RepID=UPI002174E5B9|nr:hypothetical protein [Streptomyces sp. SCUT-3]